MSGTGGHLRQIAHELAPMGKRSHFLTLYLLDGLWRRDIVIKWEFTAWRAQRLTRSNRRSQYQA